MLSFVFAALIVLLDQFFKRWIVQTLELGETGPVLIPGVLGLIYHENTGAMLGILSGRQWLLAGIAFVASVILILIILRYNEGFWGTLGLASVLGGAVGNLIDRVFNDGKVIDMFQTLFVRFPIFNFADVFITLGFLVFLIHFIALSFKREEKEPVTVGASSQDEYYDAQSDGEYDEFPEIDAMVSAKAEQETGTLPELYPQTAQSATEALSYDDPRYPQTAPLPQIPLAQESEFLPGRQYSSDETGSLLSDYDSVTDTTTDTTFNLDEIVSDLDSIGDYSVDDILREYGFDDK